MWNELTPAWQACFEEAWTAYCAGCIPIGAVVVDAYGEVVGRGRNRIAEAAAPAEPDPSRRVFGHELAHAELNVLLALPLAGWDKTLPNSPRQWTLYTTMEPCPLCLGAFYMSGLRQLHYASRDPYAGSVNLLGATPYLSRKPIRVTGPHPQLEPVCAALLIERTLRAHPGPGTLKLLDLWRQVTPHGVALGERLFAQQALPSLQAAGATAADMVTHVAREWEQVSGPP